MVPLVVDPEALFAAGGSVDAAGGGLAANLTILAAGMSAHTGLDVAGMVFGLGYQEAAASLLKAAAAAVNACRSSGVAIQQGAVNYSNAEAASTLGGGSGGLQPPAEPAKITPPGPPGTLGPGQPPPPLWALVQSFLDDVWPDGDVAALHAAAGRWRGFGAAAGGMQGALNASKSLFDTQHLPEGGLIDAALTKIGASMGKIGEGAGELARRLDGFAREVEHAQDAIRDLLNQLGSLTDVVHDVVLVIEGKAIEEIKRIATDIAGVQHNLGRQAQAYEQAIKIVTQLGDNLVVDLEKHARRELTQFLGDEVGNPVATVFDTVVNANEGMLKGALGSLQGIAEMDPRRFLIDPEGAAATWKGMFRGSLVDIALHPEEGLEAGRQNWRSLLHLDDWSTARPGLGLGENAFDIASFFIPGGEEAGAASDGASAAARGAEAAADAERAGGRAASGVPGLAARGPLADIAKSARGLTEDLDGLSGKLPKIEPPGGQAVGLPPGKPPEGPVGPGKPPEGPVGPTPPRSPEPGPRGPGEPGGPNSAVATHDSPPPGQGGPRDRPHEYGPVPTDNPRSALPAPRVHEPAPAGASTEPGSASADGPHTPPPTDPALKRAPAGTPPSQEHLSLSSHEGGIPETPHGSPPHDGAPHEPGDGNSTGGKHESGDPHDGSPDESNSHSEISPDLTAKDLSALADYTGTGYEDLNDALRSNKLDASQHARAEALGQALNKLPPYEGPVVRGTNLPPEVLAQYRPGEFVIEKGFLSTTTDPSVAQSDAFAGNVEFRITSFTGREVAAFSVLPEEQEVLFAAHTRFFVLSKTVDPATRRTIIEMVEE
ncbi:WXG100-like domain-containing protein [Mycobacterium sp. Marseille-P9652]|uniref:WXG100-like domain-containing protein n=1 Tax=Mycobacterium sp. Marseille-P9652 TaxID=2654950 RepID=UPI0012E71A2D|nr:ADP-ribosyltransferase domain-containing protein [Mycobacterium sp. Marseille-P9652]